MAARPLSFDDHHGMDRVEWSWGCGYWLEALRLCTHTGGYTGLVVLNGFGWEPHVPIDAESNSFPSYSTAASSDKNQDRWKERCATKGSSIR